jgi:hypothetical protein
VFPGLSLTRVLGALGVIVFAVNVSAQEPPPPTGVIEGTVFDSLLTGKPLRRATVYVVGTMLTATTDDRGRFTIAGVPEGEHVVTFAHASYDSAGVQAPMVDARVTAFAKTRVTIATPAGRSLIKAYCAGAPGERTGLLMGVVRDVDTGRPLHRARVVSKWFEITFDRGGPHYETLEAAAVTDQQGVFRLCGVPSDIPVYVRAHTATHESGRVEVYFSYADVAFRDFTVSLADSAAQVTAESALEASTDSTATLGPTGTSMVRGVVRDMNGRPVANARVGLLDFAASALTNSDGRFALSGVAAGTQTVEIRALGYHPVRQVVTLKSRTPADLDPIVLGRAAQKLASVRVVGTRKDSRLTKFGFEERRRRTNGFFMDAEEIARKSGIYLGDVLRFAPGMMPQYTAKGRTFTMRSTAGGNRCTPSYYLDGMRWFPLDAPSIIELERFMSLNDVAAVEVYSSAAGMPMQFDNGNGCGSVVFWTK